MSRISEHEKEDHSDHVHDPREQNHSQPRQSTSERLGHLPDSRASLFEPDAMQREAHKAANEKGKSVLDSSK